MSSLLSFTCYALIIMAVLAAMCAVVERTDEVNREQLYTVSLGIRG